MNVEIKLNQRVSSADLNAQNFDEVIIATGIKPRTPAIEGIDSKHVHSYVDVVKGDVKIGKRVAIVGAGGIGFDVAELLSHGAENPSQNIPEFMRRWGVDMSLEARGGIESVEAQVVPSPREIYLLQRKQTKPGAGLGKTTGWIHRLGLMKKNVKMLSSCQYERIDEEGFHLLVDGKPVTLAVDDIVICAGQEPLRELCEGLDKPYHLVGGSDVASELDAKRAIDQATRLALQI